MEQIKPDRSFAGWHLNQIVHGLDALVRSLQDLPEYFDPEFNQYPNNLMVAAFQLADAWNAYKGFALAGSEEAPEARSRLRWLQAAFVTERELVLRNVYEHLLPSASESQIVAEHAERGHEAECGQRRLYVALEGDHVTPYLRMVTALAAAIDRTCSSMSWWIDHALNEKLEDTPEYRERRRGRQPIAI